MDDFENDIDGDTLLASLDFDTMKCDQFESPLFVAPSRIAFPAFPYPSPYPQQIDMMRTLYSTLSLGKCGILESPTGTGKSLSLITSCLHWLVDYNKAIECHLARLRNGLEAITNESASNINWVAAHSRQRKRRAKLISEIEPLESNQFAINKAMSLIQKAKESRLRVKSSLKIYSKLSKEYAALFPNLNPDAELKDKPVNDVDEDSFLMDFLPEQLLLKEPEENTEESAKSDCRAIQIIYCSRTHSQLSQVLDEVKKIDSLSDEITVLTLASRQLLCVNEYVYSLKNASLIRDACLDLVGGKNNKKMSCKYRVASSVDALSDHLLGAHLAAPVAASRMRDGRNSQSIEDVPVNGCPYYANRKGLHLAQLVLAPYQTVVVPGSREAAGLVLCDNILIFDEAHNLLEAVASSFSAMVSHADLHSTNLLLDAYLNHYRAKLSAISLLRIRQLKQVVTSCLMMLNAESVGLNDKRRQRLDSENRSETSEEAVYTVSEWLFVAGIDHINMSYLVTFLKNDHCIQKIAGFGKWFVNRKEKAVKKTPTIGTGLSLSACFEKIQRIPKSEVVLAPKSKKVKLDFEIKTPSVVPANSGIGIAGPCLFALLSLLEALVQSEDDGRLIVRPLQKALQREERLGRSMDADGQIRFIILNPGRYLQSAVQEARSVLLIGGTMQPFDEFVDQVFHPAGKKDSEITLFSCDHVIDTPRQLAIFCLPASCRGVIWDFTFKNRNDESIMNECGEFLLGIFKMVPGGIVVFFPSFDYLALVWAHWKSTGMLERLQAGKKLFKEPRQSITLAQVMQAFTLAASSEQGSCIACVIGGKLSEGINFSDNLARAVVIVGLPYPNVHSVGLREKMKFLNQKFSKTQKLAPASKNSLRSYLTPGQRYCDALCMRSVNQAIGRAIRHANDYATIFLLDQRFTRKLVRDQLPRWAQKAFVTPTPQSWLEIRLKIEDFFLNNAKLMP